MAGIESNLAAKKDNGGELTDHFIKNAAKDLYKIITGRDLDAGYKKYLLDVFK